MNDLPAITWTNEKRRLSQLIGWKRNPRQIRRSEAERLSESRKEFGQPETIAIGPDNGVYNGHQRIQTWLRDFGDIEVDVRVASRPLTEQEREKLTILLHVGTVGQFDWDALSGWDAGALQGWGLDAETLGNWRADVGALDAMLAAEKEAPEDVGPQIDRAEELRERWGVESGQMWALGEHVVACGDCREPATWARLLDGDKVNGVFTSPPYAEQRKEQYGGVPTAEYVAWWEAVQANVKGNLAVDGSFFVNIKPHCEDGERVLYVFDLVLAMRREWGWRFVDELCWLHEDLPGAWPNRFRNGFEPVYQFSVDSGIKFAPRSVAKPSASVRDGRGGLQKREGGNWTLDAPLVHGMAQPSNVIHAGGNTASVSHAAAFPVPLPEFFIRAYSDTGDAWADPFLGSGTTLIACERLGRRCRGIEISPAYVAVTLQRWADLTGKTPELLQGDAPALQPTEISTNGEP